MLALRSTLARTRAHLSATIGAAMVLCLSLAAAASAQTPDNTVDLAGPVKNTLMENITAALPAVAVIFGILLAVSVVMKLVKKARSA